MKPYTNSQLLYLWQTGPAMSGGVFVYGYYGVNLPDTIRFREHYTHSGWATHTLHIPDLVREELLSCSGIIHLDNHLLWIPLRSLELAPERTGLQCTVSSARGVLVSKIPRRSGWLGLDCVSGLPCQDVEYHNGYDGGDRYFWRIEESVLSASGSNGFWGPAVQMVHAPGAYGQNILGVFGPGVPLAAWEEASASGTSEMKR